MRDPRWVAVHRGGPLTKKAHKRLIQWSYDCCMHVLRLEKNDIDIRLINALKVAQEWKNDKATVGDARKAAVEVLAAARELKDPVSIAIARAIGHAVATAHAADHSLGGALYGLQAVKFSGGSIERERLWQNKKLPEEIKELVLSTRGEKEKHMRALR